MTLTNTIKSIAKN